MFAGLLFAVKAFIGFSLLILVHELGHFIAAKLIGVRVEAFSLGFGPALKKKWGETEYRLSAIPLGGYVKMAGEEPTPDKKPAPDEFYGKSVGQRAIVFAAGSAVNLVFGLFIFVIAYGIGVPVRPPVIGDVTDGSPAWQAGLQRGDRIVEIRGVSPPIDFEDVRMAIALSRRGQSVHFVIERDGERIEKEIRPEFNEATGMRYLGIEDEVPLIVAKRPKASRKPLKEGKADLQAIYEAGLQEGDLITALQLAGDETPTPVETSREYMEAVENSRGEPITVFFARNGVPQAPVSVKPRAVGEPRLLGVFFSSNRIDAVRTESWADKAGLQEDDVILSVGEKPTPAMDVVFDALDAAPEKELTLKVERGAKEKEIVIPPRNDDESAEDAIAFQPELVVNRCRRGLPAEKAGMMPGDRIVAVNGVEVKDFLELRKGIEKGPEGQALEIAWMRGDERLSAKMTPQRRWGLGLPLQRNDIIRKAGIPGSLKLGVRKAFQWILRVYATLRGLLFGEISHRNVSGVIGIGYVAYTAARQGLGLLLYMLGIISVNLGIVNMLPIPIFDGGHLLFAAIEKIRGKAVSERVQGFASYVGLVIILSLVALTFWNDIRMLFIFS